MRIKKIKFNNHKILNNLHIDFCDEKGTPLNTIVMIGENGAGKTTLLKNIFEVFDIDIKGYKEISEFEVMLHNEHCALVVQLNDKESGIVNPFVREDYVYLDKQAPKVIYMPTEINFEKLKKVDNTFKFTPNFLNVIDQNLTENIPSLIATKINKEIFRNRNKLIGEVIDKVCEEINNIFNYMDLDVKLIGLSEDEETKPIFKNTLGQEFNINGLSSGEKQLFLRALSLKFLEVNNSIILIDEPEISLHPQWQQKIIKVYESIGINNQIIIATHSPHIVGDIEAKQLRIMKKDKDGIVVVDNEKITETYGHTIENILKTTMKVDNVRNKEISKKLELALKILEKDSYDTEEYREIFDYLRKYLGDLDKDIMLMKLEESRRKRRNQK